MSTLIFFVSAMTGIMITVAILARLKPLRKKNPQLFSGILAGGLGVSSLIAYSSALLAGGINIFLNEGLLWLGILNSVVLGFVLYLIAVYWLGRSS